MRIYSGATRAPSPPPLNSANLGLHTRSPMFETSQRETFCEAWQALKSFFGRGLPRTLLGSSARSLRPSSRLERDPLLSPPQRIALSPDFPLMAKVDSRLHPKLKSYFTLDTIFTITSLVLYLLFITAIINSTSSVH